MHIAPRAETAFCYLFNTLPAIVPLRRISEQAVRADFPDPFTKKVEEYEIPFHARDQRTLLVFDGDVPWQGVSRHVDQAQQHTFLPEPIELARVRKDRDFEGDMSESLEDVHGGMRVLTLTRRFLLAPASSGVVLRYLPENFGGRYSYFTVEVHGERSQVVWKNSSY